jgi:hypothetical protein
MPASARWRGPRPTSIRFRAVTRELTVRAELRLGAGRRMVEHEAPAGWRAHVVGLRTDWIPPGFAADASCISVWPAVPGPPVAEAPPVAGRPGTAGPWPVKTRAGLRGWTWRCDGVFADGTARRRDFVLLADDRYRYALRLDTTPSLHATRRRELVNVAESLRPVPKAPPGANRTADMWSD